MVEAARRAEAALEEGGAVYACGDNRRGQLGLGDKDERDEFCVLRSLRSKGIAHVHSGHDICLALSEDGNTYSWGGGGEGPVGYIKTANFELARRRNRAGFSSDESEEFSTDSEDEEAVEAKRSREKAVADLAKGHLEPKLIVGLEGEGIVEVGIGSTHGAAISDGGDLYVWGAGIFGQLGVGDYGVYQTPQLLESLQDGSTLRQVAIGQSHTIALTDTGTVYAWGFQNSGKLGFGIREREGVKKPFSRFFPTPIIIERLKRVVVRQIACGPNHSLALSEDGVYSWGSGDGGRLGHGDDRPCEVPTPIKAFAKDIVLQVSAGYWHSAAIVLIPPLNEGGYVYTWGSGYAGQLGLGTRTISRTPRLVQGLLDRQLVSSRVKCGPYHNVVMTDNDELFTWGSNRYNCLGLSEDRRPKAACA